jgi:hypothetical protein
MANPTAFNIAFSSAFGSSVIKETSTVSDQDFTLTLILSSLFIQRIFKK